MSGRDSEIFLDLALDPVESDTADLGDTPVDDDHGERGEVTLEKGADMVRDGLVDQGQFQRHSVSVEFLKNALQFLNGISKGSLEVAAGETAGPVLIAGEW